jgi:hypothetical protein
LIARAGGLSVTTGKKPAANNSAQIKGDINKGLSGDKRPGFDPAAAPLATDGEAAGTPLSAEQVSIARATQTRKKRPQQAGTFGNAMRRFDGAAGNGRLGAIGLAAIAAFLLGMLAVVAFVLTV